MKIEIDISSEEFGELAMFLMTAKQTYHDRADKFDASSPVAIRNRANANRVEILAAKLQTAWIGGITGVR